MSNNFNFNENFINLNTNHNFDLCGFSLNFKNKDLISGFFGLILIIFLFVGIIIQNTALAIAGFWIMTMMLTIIYYDKLNRNTMIFLIFLTIIEFILMIHFAITQRKKLGLSNKEYVTFFLPGNKDGNKLKYADINDDRELRLMKGSIYSYAKRDEMKNDFGNEFTYSFWLKVCPDNFAQSNNKWRVVFVRGLMTGDENQIFKGKTPGVYLAPNTNKLIINVALEDGSDENNAIVLDDIPLNEWFCITIVLEGRSFDCYVNGLLERSINLTGQPKIFNTDLVKGKEGFNGLIAYFRYHPNALTPLNVYKKYDVEKNLMSRNQPLETCFVEN